MKIVVNRCFGGFGLSEKAFLEYLSRKGIKYSEQINRFNNKEYIDEDGNYLSDYNIPRNDKDLVEIVEEMGKKSFGDFAELEVVEIPDDIEWEIDYYDGVEKVEEKHRSW